MCTANLDAKRVRVETSNGQAYPRKRQRRSRSKPYADIIGKVVDIPASVFGVEVPGMTYRGKVKKPDTRKGFVVVRFLDDGSEYYLPALDVRSWIREMPSEGQLLPGTTSTSSDNYAAKVLLALSADAFRHQEPHEEKSEKRNGQQASTVLSGEAGPLVRDGVRTGFQTHSGLPAAAAEGRPPAWTNERRLKDNICLEDRGRVPPAGLPSPLVWPKTEATAMSRRVPAQTLQSDSYASVNYSYALVNHGCSGGSIPGVAEPQQWYYLVL